MTKKALLIFLLFILGCASPQKVPIKAHQSIITLEYAEELSLIIPERPPVAEEKGTNDQGGVADLTDLEQDMRDILINWKQAAITGVTLFATTELSRRIDEQESGSWENYLTSLLGNTIWAATAFLSAGSGTIFGVSMAGVLIGSVPSIPSKQQSVFPEVHEKMINYMQSIYDQLNSLLRNKAVLLIENNPGITRYRAMTIFVQESFKPGLYRFDPTYKMPPTLNKQAITRIYKNWPSMGSLSTPEHS
jgi:hypothetical protein